MATIRVSPKMTEKNLRPSRSQAFSFSALFVAGKSSAFELNLQPFVFGDKLWLHSPGWPHSDVFLPLS